MRWTTPPEGAADRVPVEISYNGGLALDATRRVDQTRNTNVWVYLGTYYLPPGTGNSVLLRASDSGAAVADAVLFEHSDDSTFVQPAPTLTKAEYGNAEDWKNPEQVDIVRTDSGIDGQAQFRLRVNGVDNFVKGSAGTEVVTQIHDAGGNAIRSYSAGPLTDEFMRTASAAQIKVLAGFWLHQGGDGFYEDPSKVLQQYNAIVQQFEALKSYKAVLAWAIGNEIDPVGNMSANEQSGLYAAVESLAEYFREHDHWHPITTVHAGSAVEKILNVKALAPTVDVVSFNTYYHLGETAAHVASSKWVGPYMITEYSIPQPSERNKDDVGAQTPWGSVIEPTSKKKYSTITELYAPYILGKQDRVLGSFAFKGKDVFKLTKTWYPLFDEALRATTYVDAARADWGGPPSPEPAPKIDLIKIDGVLPEAGAIASGSNGNMISTITMDPYPAGKSQSDYTFEVTIRKDTTINNPACNYPPELPVTRTMDSNDHRKWYIPKAELPTGLYRLYYSVKSVSGATVADANIPFCRLAPGSADCAALTLFEDLVCH
jgi:hypothetical protein